MAITIKYTIRKVINGFAVDQQKSETLPNLAAAEKRAKEVLALDEIFGPVTFWDAEGFHAGTME